jgi:hypothetical protein
MPVIIYLLQTISTEYEISDPIEFMVISYSPMAASAKKIWVNCPCHFQARPFHNRLS